MSYHKGKNIRDYYDLEQELGRGSFAIVCKAVNKQTGENVAVKIFDKLVPFSCDCFALDVS